VEAAMRCIQREDFDLALIDQGSSGSEGRQVIGYVVRYNLRTPFIVRRGVPTRCGTSRHWRWGQSTI
jgi:hypothetical protein